MDGVIVIRKEKDFTSHDVVAKLRGILHMKKIGHTGTLDPDAEGVLPVALGKATRLVDMITDKEKTYEAYSSAASDVYKRQGYEWNCTFTGIRTSCHRRGTESSDRVFRRRLYAGTSHVFGTESQRKEAL